MLFNNPSFFIFCIFFFISISIATKKQKKWILLFFNYLFYGLWDWRFLFLIAFSSIVDFLIGKNIFYCKKPGRRKTLLISSLIINLTTLGFFKYFNFFLDTINGFLPLKDNVGALNIILPIGISFYTFQSISYTIDIFSKKIKPTTNLIDFLNFISFFPQLVAGPIEKAKRLLPQLENFNGIQLKNLKPALILLFMGYVKKILISDNLAPAIDESFTNFESNDSIVSLSGLILFSFQIYFDFSGYSDIARGLAKLLGVDLMINFEQPYFSTSPSQFWKRWHISLSKWLKDYLYIPLGGNRKGNKRTYINLMITMLIGGLWHGASFNFIIWGALHGIYLISYKIIILNSKKDRKKPKYKLNKIIYIIIFYVLVLITWIPFRTPDLMTAMSFFNSILFWKGNIDISEVLIILFIFIIWIMIDLPAYLLSDQLYLMRLPLWLLSSIFFIGILGIILSIIISNNTVTPFIYFEF